MTVSDEGV